MCRFYVCPCKGTLPAPDVKKIIQEIMRAKEDAIDVCKRYEVTSTLYDNISLVKYVKQVVDRAVCNDKKSFETLPPDSSTVKKYVTLSQAEVMYMHEDIYQLKLPLHSDFLPKRSFLTDL